MKKALAVARWEYLERVKTKAFIIGLFLTPIIMISMMVLPTLLATQEDSSTKAIGIIDPCEALANPGAPHTRRSNRQNCSGYWL